MKTIQTRFKTNKANFLASLVSGLIVCAIAAYGVINFKAYEKPVRTSSKPSKKKLVNYSVPSEAASAALYQDYNLFFETNI